MKALFINNSKTNFSKQILFILEKNILTFNQSNWKIKKRKRKRKEINSLLNKKNSFHLN